MLCLVYFIPTDTSKIRTILPNASVIFSVIRIGAVKLAECLPFRSRDSSVMVLSKSFENGVGMRTYLAEHHE